MRGAGWLKDRSDRDAGRCVSIVVFTVLCTLLAGCRNDMEKVALFDRKELPQQSIENVRVQRSERGVKQMVMEAPRIESYITPERKTVYPEGFKMWVYDRNGAIRAYVTGEYAVQMEEKKIVEARRNLVMVDYETGDTTYLESLVWNSSEHRIYSDDPVRSVNGQRVTCGDRFESDDEFKMPLIIGQRGTMTIEDD